MPQLLAIVDPSTSLQLLQNIKTPSGLVIVLIHHSLCEEQPTFVLTLDVFQNTLVQWLELIFCITGKVHCRIKISFHQ